MTNEKTFLAITETDLQEISKNILREYKSQVYCFYGEMGAGKTTFIKQLCCNLGVTDNTSSPTFSIINVYEGNQTIYHMDLYRLKNLKEAIDTGIEDILYSGSYCFIEWPELIESIFPTDCVKVIIQLLKNGERKIIISQNG